MEAKQRKKKKWIIWAIVAVVVIAAVVLVMNMKSKAAAAAAALANMSTDVTYTVERGTLETTITADGKLQATDTQVMTAPDGLMVKKVLAKAGDEVKAGDPLAMLDPESVLTQMIYVDDKLRSLDKRLGTGDDETHIKSPVKGRLKYQLIQTGDDVAAVMKEHGYLAILSTDGLMKLELKTDQTLEIGQKYAVRWEGGRVYGRAIRAIDGGYLLHVSDDRAPYLATVEVYDDETLLGTGVLEINSPVKVFGFSGIVDKIGYEINESVPRGKNMYAIENGQVEFSFQKKYAERQVVYERLNRLIGFSADPTIYAPFDGVVSESLLADGVKTGKVDACDKDSDAFKIQVGGATILAISVDELDIGKVQLGQKANIEFTAYGDEKFTGTVTRIAKAGKDSNGISAYAVEITLEPDDRLLVGMNGTTTIEVFRVENVITVPMDAIFEDAEGMYVYTLDAAGAKVRTPIKTGLSDAENAEVLSGLKEGDVVSYTPSAKSYGVGVMASW